MNVLIGIPTLNGPDRLARCLASIAAHTPFEKFAIKVMVCDDASTSANLDANKALVRRMAYGEPPPNGIPDLEMLMHQERKGIAAGWNSLTRFQPADVVVLINDDIEVVPHWLDALVYSVTKNPQLGTVSLNQYVGLTRGQHLAAHPGCAPHEAVPRVDYHEATILLGDGQLLCAQGSIFAFRRESYDQVGGFDEGYMAMYEEYDFGVALCHKGFMHAIVSYPVVYHMGGATLSDPQNLDVSAELIRSRQRFFEKWGGVNDLRAQFAAQARKHGLLANLHTWNTQLATLRDP